MASKQDDFTLSAKPALQDPDAKSEVQAESAAFQTDNAAAAYLDEHRAEWADYGSDEAKKVLAKIDWRLMPLIIGTITIAAVDVSRRSSQQVLDKTDALRPRKLSFPTPPCTGCPGTRIWLGSSIAGVSHELRKVISKQALTPIEQSVPSSTSGGSLQNIQQTLSCRSYQWERRSVSP
jgi:hypothetical protein